MIDAVLERLCERAGIVTRYADIWGREHRPPEATLRALLSSLGLAGTDDAEATLERMEEREWRNGLPPVWVCHEDGAHLQVRVTLPAAASGVTLRWRLETEDGTVRAGELPPGARNEVERRRVGSTEWVAAWCVVPQRPGLGYHHLSLHAPVGPGAPWHAQTTLVVAPRQCYRPPALAGDGRTWGLCSQLYALRSSRNWGIGDFTDLLRLVELAADAGAGMVGVSPLHALFPHNPAHASPYSPSSRHFLNVLHLDVEAIPEFARCDEAQARVAGEEFQSRLRTLRASEQVLYEEVAAAKSEVLDMLYRHFRDRHLAAGDARARAFRAFQREEGAALRRHALFEALQAHLYAGDAAVWGWPVWPERYRDPHGADVAEFERTHQDEVQAREYLQWQARVQLDRAGARARELALGVGLYQDLAVGVDAGGAETWSDPETFALGVRVGAPPDDFNLAGQDWGLPPWRPDRLRERGYAPFIETLRASMRASGALRIDHVMGLARQFWIPPGCGAADGTYVRFPLHDLLGVLALESHRNRCLVVGEDLGTVPDEVREGLEAFDILSYRLLYFSKDAEGAFEAPPAFPARALVCAATHDLPTLAGFWAGADVELRHALGLFPDQSSYEAQLVARAEDRARLQIALAREGLLPGGEEGESLPYPEMTPELATAIHRFLARSPARVLAVQLEDLLGQQRQVNLPGTTDAYPNWRQKLPLELEDWLDEPRVQLLLGALRDERGDAASPPVQTAHRGLPPGPVIPRATYRLQLHGGMDLDAAAGLVPYLDELGISHAYSSPLLQARAGSTHGYDITDHASINPELGGADGLARFAGSLDRHGMSLLLDTVPNHMGVMGSDNGWWLDVLENGPASRYARHFDIDWAPLKDELRGKVLVPVLGDHYGNVLDEGGLQLVLDRDSGALAVYYHEHCFPLDPRTYPLVLGRRLDLLAARMGTEHGTLLAFQSLLTAFANLPTRSETGPDAVAERARDGKIHQARLAALLDADADLAVYAAQCLREFNGAEDHPADRGLMHELLEAQAYRLAYWRVAADDINYRRFFDINELAALRMERDEVFEAAHRLVFDLIDQGTVTGLRVDHPDGLFDPAAYFRRVQAHAGALTGDTGSDLNPRPLYLLAEKILAPGEAMPADWEVHGTTGYDFSALAGGVFVDPRGADGLTRAAARFTRCSEDLAELEYGARRQVMEEALAAELNVMARELSHIAESDPHTRDLTEPTLRKALSAVVACFPVYRTYVGADGASPRDEACVDHAVAAARRRARGIESTVFDFVRDALLARIAEGKSERARARALGFAMRFAQFTAPVAAKGVEDTAFYRHHRLESLNEVGDDPARFGVSVKDLHRDLAHRASQSPHAMLGTSTHDSKRSEDVRMRLNVLSEMPEQWSRHVEHWSALNAAQRLQVDGRTVPDPGTEYSLYQSLLGIWPLASGVPARAVPGLCQRLERHVVKAAREAKLHTSWTSPDTAFEEALVAFAGALLDEQRSAPFLDDFLAFVRRVARPGMYNSLGLTLLKLTAPGVPDFYQGNELWRFDLVDPDNRRPVDFQRRREHLASLSAELGQMGAAALARRLLSDAADGRIKLYVIWRALALRRAVPDLFQAGEYLPLPVHGEHAEHVVAFARRAAGRMAVTVVPRLTVSLLGDAPERAPGDAPWGDTRVALPDLSGTLSPGTLRDCFTGVRRDVDAAHGELAVSDLLAGFPVALLVSDDGAGG